jgi:short subunit dehydrogenase-like uncharacterized protein
MTATRPAYDLVVFGATSFVGQILARYLLQEFGLRGKLRWAIAGRSGPKLEELRKSLGAKATKLPILLADAADEAALGELCRQTRVVASTVGPYALYGEPLVKVCAKTGTDYCDLTGEVQWIRRMMDRYEATARKSGARIVHCCGFDSIPSDLGVHFLQREAVQRFGKPCTKVKLRVKGVSGGFSGGTVASLMNAVKEATADPKLRKELGNPYSICPKGHGVKIRQPQVKIAELDADFGSWVAPFVMSAVNTRIVHRTNALTRHSYGKEFVYDEAVLTGPGLKGRLTAAGITAGIAGVMAAGTIAPVRAAVERFIAPPGSGPSKDTQKKGFWDLRLLGQTADGRSLRIKVVGQGDPGYGSTSKMLGQAAACLALDVPKSKVRGGFWTPATALGDQLITRLEKHADVEFEVLAR